MTPADPKPSARDREEAERVYYELMHGNASGDHDTDREDCCARISHALARARAEGAEKERDQIIPFLEQISGIQQEFVKSVHARANGAREGEGT